MSATVPNAQRVRRAIGRRVRRAALAATLLLLVGSAPAAAQYVGFSTPCNPSYAYVVENRDRNFPVELYLNGIAWVDYFGFPVAVSSPFRLIDDPHFYSGRAVEWPVPSPASVLPGQYTLHALLQGNGELSPLLYFFFTTVSGTTKIDPTLNTDCSPIAAAPSASAARVAVRQPSAATLARGVRALRRDSANWFGRSRKHHPTYPKARICGRTVCIQPRAGAAWKPVTRR